MEFNLLVPILLWSLALPGHASTPAVRQEAPAAEAPDDMQRFVELLASVRAGTDENIPPLQRVAKRLSEKTGRADILEVTDYYAGLLAFERKQGLRDYQSFLAIWNRVLELEREGVRGVEWREERRAILDELGKLASSVQMRADFVPAARALSLRARLETEILTVAFRDTSVEDPDALLREATRDAQAAIDLFRRAGQVRTQLEPLLTLARLKRAQLENDAARELFEQCLDLAQQLSDAAFREHALHGLISLARRDGNLRELDRLLYELADLKGPSENWPLAWRQAERLIHLDRPERALGFLDRNPPRSQSDLQTWHVLRANAYTRLGDWDAARRETEASGSHPLRLARIDLERNAPELALTRLELPVEEDRDPRLAIQFHVIRGQALLELDRPEDAVVELELAKNIGARLETRLSFVGDESKGRSNITGEVLGLHSTLLLAEALARSDRSIEAIAAIEAAHARRLRDGKREPDVRAWASHFEAGLVSWIIGPDHGLRFRLDGQSGEAQFQRLEQGRLGVERAVRRLREALCEGRESLAAEIGGEIVEQLFSELNAGSQARSGRVLLLLHGPLEQLPVEWMIETGLLPEGWTPVILPGLPAQSPGAWSRPERWSLCGAPESSGQASLPAAETELHELAELMPGARRVQGLEFDRESLLESMTPGAGLHVATHLLQHDDGLRRETRLVLSSGESVGPRAIQDREIALAMCVLATCESGGGAFEDAEGAQGIAQAFLATGTRNLVVTTWPVGDRAGRTFSLAFHRALLSGLLPSESVRLARAELRAAGFLAADWAAFRLVGRD